MYRAVLVDDEIYDLEGLRVLIPWGELGVQVVFCAEKPLAALQYIENHKFDILVTDIKMPVLTGLDLSRKALENNPNVKIVFISGYQDFEYAKQAMHLKADGYILKPVDDNEVIDVLRKVVQQLEAQNEQKREATAMLLESYDFIKTSFVQHLLEGGVEPQKLRTFLANYPLEVQEGKAIAVLVEIDDALWRYGHEQNGSMQGAEAELHSIGAMIEAGGLGQWCKYTDSQLGFLYTADPERVEAELEGLCEEIRNTHAFTVTVSYGEPADFPEGIPHSFRQVKERMGYKMFFGKNRLIHPSMSKLKMAEDVKDIQTILDATFKAMTNYGLVAICDCVDALFETVSAFKKPVEVHSFSIHIASRLEAYLNQLNESFASLLGWKMEHLDLIRSFETIEDIKSWFRKTLFEIAERLFMRRNGKNRRLIEQIENYVKEHVSEDITLKEVANRFSYSPNHLGYLFRENSGESFNDYVVKIRMQMAMNMLKNPQYKIYEVSEQVGYKSLAYFSRMFREHVGMSPGEFRRQG
ncbi:helix-turn-helix domain-containing protein [Paenibacillus puerhi]|uniref:helix-turn-helix domain-containing protein n=1 Tax=Paenibacillus puerhi TaxID=2692622 RepID=UPI0013576560|nr:helix-turn-helix domain-containing protein [Paenibacillus puerhi]